MANASKASEARSQDLSWLCSRHHAAGTSWDYRCRLNFQLPWVSGDSVSYLDGEGGKMSEEEWEVQAYDEGMNKSQEQKVQHKENSQ